ncbi:MAG TPA: PQQ-binding-like beta-propeller repeat protein [Verrucomicrobiae bacterium]|jgi:hypothetical protein
MKIQCACGAKYAFDLTPEMAREPVKFVCPQCGADSSEIVNQLVQQALAEQNLPAAPVAPISSVPTEPPRPAPMRLKISHAEKPAEPPPAEPAVENATSKYCSKHRGVLATEKCTVCDKPICPQCLSLFGYFCSPLCKNKAEMQGIAAPAYAGSHFAVKKQFWRKTSLIAGTVATVIALLLGIWIWYAWFGSVPHTWLSVRFADDDRAYAGSAQLAGQNQLVFLHGGTLARYDLKIQKEIWSQSLVTPAQVAAIVQAENDAHARLVAESNDRDYMRTPLPSAVERMAKISLQSALTLSISNHDIWVAAPGKLTRYDWDSGKVAQEVSSSDFNAVNGHPAGGGLFSHDNHPLDPDKVATQAQNLTLPARIALPALLGNDAHEQQLEAALRDEETRHPRTGKPPAHAVEHFDLVAGENSSAQFGVKLLQQNLVTREAMRAKPTKSALDNPNLNVTQTTAVANDILNEMQRNRGGDQVTEDESRYQVTVRISTPPGIADWTGEVTGPPELFCLQTVNVIAAGKSVIVLDKQNKKLWAATLTYDVSLHAGTPEESPYGAGPCVEHDGSLYVFDQAVLSAFDLTTGNARWHLPSVGIVGLFFDASGHLYVNTTTGNPDDIKYSRQIDITKATAAVLQKIEPASGKILWSVKPGGFVSYLSGKFIYAVQSYDPNPTDEEVLNDSLVGLQKPPYLSIVRIDPKNGRILWQHTQDRCPIDIRFDQNTIELVFKREVQVLKYLTL